MKNISEAIMGSYTKYDEVDLLLEGKKVEELDDPKNMDDDEKQEFEEDIIEIIKEDPDEFEELKKTILEDPETPDDKKEELKKSFDELEKKVKNGEFDKDSDGADDEEDGGDEDAGEESGEDKEDRKTKIKKLAAKIKKSVKSDDVKESLILEKNKGYLLSWMIAGPLGLVLNGIRRHRGKKKVEKNIKRMKAQVENAPNDEKEEYQKKLDDYVQSRTRKDGTILVSKRAVKKNIEKKRASGEISSSYSWDQQKSDTKDAKRSYSENKRMLKNKVKTDYKNQKDDIRVSNDGSEIIPRKKRNGSGVTYVRMKNGKEVGYATKEEYQNAKQKSNEGMISLRDALLESFES